MEWYQLLYFKKLAEAENFTKAAESLYITQPSLSKAISNLETEFGVKLIERHGKKSVLNPYGIILLDKIDQAFEIMESARREISELKVIRENRVEMRVMPNLMDPQLIQSLKSTIPNLSVLAYQYQSKMEEQLNSGAIDYFVITPTLRGPNISSIPLIEEKGCVLLPKAHAFAGKSEIDISELKGESFLSYFYEMPSRKRLEKMCRKAGFKPKIDTIGGSLRDLIPGIRNGAGITIVSEYAASLYNLTGVVSVPLAGDIFCDNTMEICWKTDSANAVYAEKAATIITDYLEKLANTQLH